MRKTSHTVKKKVFMLVTLGERGGAQKYVQDIADAVKEDYEVTIGAGVSTGDELLEWANKNSIRTVTFTHLKRGLTLGTLPAFADFPFWFNLVRHLRREHYDIVHLSSSKVGYLGALASFFVPGTKVVFTAHGWAFEDPTVGKKWLWVAVNKLGAYFTDRIIVLSDHDFNSALRHHIAPPRKLYKVYNGFNPTATAYRSRNKARTWLRDKAGIDLREAVVGTIANLYKTKNLKALIAAVAHEKKHLPHLVIIGGPGSQPQEELERQAHLLGVRERVHFVGPVENAAQYLRAFDIYAISSLKEGLPFSLLEAMGAKVPIVATPVGGIAEVLFATPKKPAGVKISPHNSQEAAHALESLLSDSEQAEKLAKNAKERLRTFSKENMIRRTKWIYTL